MSAKHRWGIAAVVLSVIAVVAVSGVAAATPSPKAHAAKHGRRGPRGPRGFPGSPGPRGPAGGFSTANIKGVAGSPVTMAPLGSNGDEVQRSDAQCPAGSLPISGGWVGEAADPPLSATVAASGWTNTGSWAVVMINDDSQDFAAFHALAECASGGASAAAARSLTQAKPLNVAAELAAVRAKARQRHP